MSIILTLLVIIFKCLAGMGLIVLPLTMIGYGLFFLIMYRSPKNWKQTEALITRSIIKSEEEPGGHVSFRNEVDFSYLVDEKQYNSSNKKAPINTTYGKSETEKLARTYAQGQRMVISYNPAHPSIAVLGAEAEILSCRKHGFFLFIAGLISAPFTFLVFMVIFQSGS